MANMSVLRAYRYSTTALKDQYKFWLMRPKNVFHHYAFQSFLLESNNLNLYQSANRNEYLALSIALNHFKTKAIANGDEISEARNYSQMIKKLTNPYLKLLFAYILEHKILLELIVSRILC
jgi:hypothetical protein